MTTPTFHSVLLRQILAASLAACAGVAAHAQEANTSGAAASAVAAPVQERRWIDAHSQKPLAIARQAIRRLAAAEQEGLSAQDYQVAALEDALVAAIQKPLSAQEGAQLENRLNQAVVRYLNDLHSGRINPKTIGEHYAADTRPPFDAEALLAQFAPSGNLDALWQAATPQTPMYAALRKELQRYLALRQDPAWAEALPLPPKGSPILAGQTWPGLDAVAQRLVRLGDLSAVWAAAPVAFGPELAAAIQTFQARHGLPATGHIDRATVQQLNVPPAERAAQIAQTMERLRWVPLQHKPRMIVVNVPEYRLRAYTVNDAGQVQHVLPINVIVGKANSNRTVLFSEDMKWIEFSPYWNVPSSITRKEMLPRLQRDPDYVRRNNYEIVGANGRTTQATPEALAALASGQARLRQRPGRGNALGGVKFMLPNRYNIYLHHTPSTGLFKRADRALSHGCIRVEDPAALAHFVLQDDPKWPLPRIREVLDKRISHTVHLQTPVPVVIIYFTTVVGEDGKLYFLPDVYGQDKRLKNALLKRQGA